MQPENTLRRQSEARRFPSRLDPMQALHQTFSATHSATRRREAPLASEPRTQGERDRELRTAFLTIYRCHAASMNTDNRFNESKSKSMATEMRVL